MRDIPVAILLLMLLFASEATNWAILREILAPRNPPLLRVRNLEQARGFSDLAVLDFIGLVERYSYPAEEHKVTTADGYQLLLHRIPGSPQSNVTRDKRVAFLQHGILCSSDAWVLMGSGKDLAFLLADAGYDVWVGNVRGNTYCRSHRTRSTNDPEFWNFSYHEYALLDLPAMIDYVLNTTGKDKIYYIGHSMGTTMSYVLLSSKPEYNKKFSLVVSFSPVAYWFNPIAPIYGHLKTLIPIAKRFLESIDVYDLAPQSTTNAIVLGTACRDSSAVQLICTALLFTFVGIDPPQLNTTLIPYVLSYYPAGTGLKVLNHYVQNIQVGDFKAYDYGPDGNYRKYNQKIPPSYNVEKISAPQAFFYGLNDILATPANVMEAYKRMSSVKVMEPVSFKWFNHLDFLWAIDAKTLLYDRVIEVMRYY